MSLFTMGDLKDLCADVGIYKSRDNKARMVAYGLFKTNRKAAMDYVEGYPRRKHIENQKLPPSYGAS